MTHRDIKIVLKTIFYMVVLAFMVWVGWSWADVVTHQDLGGTDCAMNLFLILFGQ